MSDLGLIRSGFGLNKTEENVENTYSQNPVKNTSEIDRKTRNFHDFDEFLMFLGV